MRLYRIIAALLLPAAIAFPAFAAVPPLSIYGELPSFEMAALSPSGERIAFVADIGGARRLLVLEGTSKPLQSIVLGDIKVRGIYWAGEKTVLVQRSDTQRISRLEFTADRIELFSMLVLPLDGKEPWAIFADSKTVTGGVRGFYGVRQKGDRYFGYFGGITLERSSIDRSSPTGLYLSSMLPDLYEVDLASRKTRLIAPRIRSDGYRRWIVGPDGAVSATLDFFSRDGQWVIRNRDGQRIVGGTHPTGGVSLMGLGAAPDTLIYGTEDDEGSFRWMEVPVAGGEGKEVRDDIGIRANLFDEYSRRLMGYMLQGDYPTYHFLDPKHQAAVDAALKAFPGKSAYVRDWNRSVDKLIVETSGAGDPGTWWLVDTTSSKVTTLGMSYTLQSQDVGPTRRVHYKATDGLDISAVLTLPPGAPEKNLPVVVMPHGGPAARDYPEFDWWAQAFASRGYAVLQPNFRGSTGYGSAFRNAGDGEWGRAMQSDISDGLMSLAQAGTVDPNRACIVGASYGGYAALAGVTLQTGLYRCAAAVAGVSDPAKMIESDIIRSGADRTLIRALKQQVGTQRDLREVSPVRFAAKADAPILLIHGKDDTVVEYEQSVAMAKALKDAGKAVEFVTLDGEDHWLSRGETRLAMLNAIVAFVEKHSPAQPR